MLINATHKQEEMRVAIVDGQFIQDLIIESCTTERHLGDVCYGTIDRIEPSLNAAFVKFGSERHGFLPLKEIAPTCFREGFKIPEDGQISISEAVKEGQNIIVQVEKEQRGTKGAALTTFITLSGSFLVLMPNNPRAGGISRRIDGAEREVLRQHLNELVIPEEMGVIIRTAACGRSLEELKWDLDILLTHWAAIKKVSQERPAPFLIYQESNAVIRAIRDYANDVNEILIDDAVVYQDALSYITLARPAFIERVKFYDYPTPLFNRFQIEGQIESAFQHTVTLPSGGSIVIDRTEALVAIDINSARATKGGDIEETALTTNLEAAEEIARQLRLRDIGGLIVIDFIDMIAAQSQRAVENRLIDALRSDRARVQVGEISRFGLLEMSRQRLRPSLGESTQISCPRCAGQGTIRGTESLALSVMRLIEEEAVKENTARVVAQLPNEVATYVLNEKRYAISEIEARQKITVLVIPNAHLIAPHYQVERIRKADIGVDAENIASYDMVKVPESEVNLTEEIIPKVSAEPAVKVRLEDLPSAPTPSSSKIPKKSLLKRLVDLFKRKAKTEEASRPPRRHHAHRHGGRPNNRRSSGQHYRKRNNNRHRPSGNRAPSQHRREGNDS